MLRSFNTAGLPFKCMVPEAGFNNPATIFSKVVLPQPLGPTKETNSFLKSLNEISLREGVSQDIV